MPATLRRAADIQAVFTAGTVAHGPAMVVRARLRGDSNPCRWTVVAGKKIGGAVERNRAKRRLRMAVRSTELPLGADIVVLARPAALGADFSDLCAQVARLTAAAAALPERSR